MARIAIFQMNSGIDPAANLSAIEQAMAQAMEGGADVLFTPEMSILLDSNRKRAAATMQDPDYLQIPGTLSDLARKAGVDLALGSMPVPLSNGKSANRSFYFSSQGSAPTIYDKLHMFDVDLSTGESWRESSAYNAGDAVAVRADTPLGRLGLTICYDVRFPGLFDALGRQKCDTISVPAAFTRPTGAAHWHVMLRARAIEASAFVVAAAQTGEHEDGRATYGHSLVIDPWGEVLLDMGDAPHANAPGVGFCDIDLSRIDNVRAQVPSLANRRAIPTSKSS